MNHIFTGTPPTASALEEPQQPLTKTPARPTFNKLAAGNPRLNRDTSDFPLLPVVSSSSDFPLRDVLGALGFASHPNYECVHTGKVISTFAQ
ncbi:hypothetical protein RvY_03057-3 [Ramazzottius varieornatus]|uniref:Uncharacterized protein n=1 Tax=Ramazzottius varieornatus TaxID=947166 RepID=A0A1D1USH1_RAMVA|nr:hypothetical protein RvY_03057-3 [Ramazzottius varieornatus]